MAPTASYYVVPDDPSHMRQVRFDRGDGPETAAIDDGGTIDPEGDAIPTDQVQLLPPCEPSKVVCVGRNYVDHADELDSDVPDFPLLFFKPPSAVVAAFDDVRMPDETDDLHYEGEVGLVVGERCRRAEPGDATDVLAGYTAVNDVTMRDWQDRERQWARAKGGDSFCPIGPYLQTEFRDDVAIETRVNGDVRQSASTDDVVFGFDELVVEISRFMTLEPGDVIATGTPAGVGAVAPGDVVGVEVEGVGTLRNEVVAADS